MKTSEAWARIYWFFGPIGILLVALKADDLIDWSWVVVTSPFWGPLAFFCVIAILATFWRGVIALTGG